MHSAPRQLSLRAVILGILLAAILAGANAYLGLFAGMTVSASIPAAVISMAILRFFRDSNILENNIVQTAASAGESLAAGVIFTFPALIILGYWNVFDYWWVTLIAGLGGLLGVMFTVPLRRSLIVESKLSYPEGTATAEVLEVGAAGGSGAKFLAGAGIAGALIKFAETGLRLWPGTAQVSTYVGERGIAYLGTNLSPALIGVGYIVGLNVAVLIFAGGALSWFVAIPAFSAFFLDSEPELLALFNSGTESTDFAFAIWDARIRYLGVGAMLVGGIWALVSIRGSVFAGIRSGLNAGQQTAGVNADHRDQDAPLRWVMIAAGLALIPLLMLYQLILDAFGIALALTLIMVIAGFLFSTVAAYMAGLVGSSNNPISGITIATILFTSLILAWLFGTESAVGVEAAILVGAVVCCAAAIGGDNMQDLKAGHLLGATPWRQQVMQCVGVLSAALVIAPILNLLVNAYGIGTPSAENPNALLAPQATLMASVAEGVFGGGLPWGMVAAGAALGIVIIGVDETLRRLDSQFRAPVLAVAVGIYLPLELSVPILLGGVIAWLAARRRGEEAAGDTGRRTGMLFAAGLITGEALVGILMAIPIVIANDPDIIALNLDWGTVRPALTGLAVILATGFALFRVSIRMRD